MRRVLAATLTIALVLLGLALPVGPAEALPTYPDVELNEVGSIKTTPFFGSGTSMSDAEGMAHVPADGALWVADDQQDRLYEVDLTTGQLRRTVNRAALEAAPQFGGGPAAGPNTAGDLESLAYDPVDDVIYAFAGSCCGTVGNSPTAFRLTRPSPGAPFSVESHQPLPAESNYAGAAVHPDGTLWLGIDHAIRPFDFDTNSRGPITQLPAPLGRIEGLGFSTDGEDLFFVTNTDDVARIDYASNTLVPNYDFDMVQSGVLDPRAVELIDDQLYVLDGYDFYQADDPNEYAVRIFDIIDPTAPLPTAVISATPTSGPSPLTVSFDGSGSTDDGTIVDWSWDFGDGSVANGPTAQHFYPNSGDYTAALTVTDDTALTHTTTVPIAVSCGTCETHNPIADTYTNTSRATKNYGTKSEVKAKSGYEYRSFLRFDLTGPSEPITRATLRMYVTNASDRGGTLHLASGGWDELTLTASNEPTIGQALHTAGDADSGTWVDFDLTGEVVNGAVYDLALLPDSTNTLGYSSREGSQPPQLITESAPAGEVVPMANFVSSPTAGNAPLAVTFTDMSTGPAGSWEWDFGDGNTSTLQHPIHTYTAEGDYTVSLTIVNTLGSNSITKPDYITVGAIPPPSPTALFFPYTPPNGLAPHTVVFANISSGSPTSQFWDFGDGSTATSFHGFHTYETPGTYTVTLTAANAHGSDILTATDVVTISSAATFTPSDDAYVSSVKASKNYGFRDTIRAKSGYEYRSFLKFDVTGLSGAPGQATLRMFVDDAASSGGAIHLAGAGWDEGTVTWNSAPAVIGGPIAVAGAAVKGQWVEFDVTSAITGSGTYSFALLPTVTNTLKYTSTEGGLAPELIITAGG